MIGPTVAAFPGVPGMHRDYSRVSTRFNNLRQSSTLYDILRQGVVNLLEGPRRVTPDEVANIFAEVLGRRPEEGYFARAVQSTSPILAVAFPAMRATRVRGSSRGNNDASRTLLRPG